MAKSWPMSALRQTPSAEAVETNDRAHFELARREAEGRSRLKALVHQGPLSDVSAQANRSSGLRALGVVSTLVRVSDIVALKGTTHIGR